MDSYPVCSGAFSFASGIKRNIIIFTLITAVFTACVQAGDTWQPVETRTWVQAGMPPGWSSQIEKNATENPDSAKISAYSPDHNSRLTYILDHTGEEMTTDQIRQFQSSYMSKAGFRICKTKDPVIEEKNGAIAYRQTYVRGTDDAAVIGTITYPNWGQAHFILTMEGPQAVADYYESVPAQVQEHIIPTTSDEKPAI